MLWNQLEPLHSAPSTLLPLDSRSKMKVVLLVQATRAEKGIGAVSKLHQKFVECSLVHKFCTIFAPTHSFCSGDAFFTKMGDEQWLRGVTKTGGLPPDKLWNWQHMLAFGQLTIPIVAFLIMYCTVTTMQNVDIYELFSQATCWLFMQSTLLTGQAGDVWVCLRIWSQRHWSAWVVCSPVCLYCRTQPHLSQQPTRLHIVLNEHHAPLPSSAPPLCHTRGM